MKYYCNLSLHGMYFIPFRINNSGIIKPAGRKIKINHFPATHFALFSSWRACKRTIGNEITLITIIVMMSTSITIRSAEFWCPKAHFESLIWDIFNDFEYWLRRTYFVIMFIDIPAPNFFYCDILKWIGIAHIIFKQYFAYYIVQH